MDATQDEFADKLEIHVNNYGNIERGLNCPGGETIIRLITNCRIDITELVLEVETQAKRIYSDKE